MILELDWQDFLQDELASMPLDQRLEILTQAIRHNSLQSLLAARDTSIATRFKHASCLRDVADRLEHMPS
jgi:hypothetical protein